MEYNVEQWLSDRGYKTAKTDGGLSVTDGKGTSYTLDTAGFTKGDMGYQADGNAIRTALSKSGAGAPAGYTPLRNTLAGQGAYVGYDKTADAPIVNGQLLNKNDSRLIKIGDDYWIEENYAKNFVPKEYENPYKRETKTLLSELADMEFSYDPSKDASLKAAQEEAMLSAKQSANSRGLLGGSTAEIMRQRAAQDLVPVYEQMAYSRFQDEREAKIDRLSILEGLAENAFAEYEGEANLRLSNQKIAQSAQDAANTEAYNNETLKAKNFANQLDKVIALGEVDEEAASILGIPAGTLTADQKQFVESLMQAAGLQAEKLAQERLLAEEKYRREQEADDKAWEREKEKIALETEGKIRVNQLK